MCKNALHVLLALALVTIVSISIGCHLLLPYAPSQQSTNPCYYFSAQFYRQLSGSSEQFTENWCMWGWPEGQTPMDYCYEKLGHYLQTSMSPHVGWNVRNISWTQVSREQATDCGQPTYVPKMWGGPIGAVMRWLDPPSSQAYAYIYLVDKSGQTRTAEPAVKSARIDVAERSGMPDSQTGTYIVGKEHARFTDMYLDLKPFWLGDMQVTKCYIQSIGGVIAEKDGPGYEYRIHPGNAKFFFYGTGNIGGNGGTTSYCFTNSTVQTVQLYQGPGMTMFALSLVLPSSELGQEMLIRVTLVKPWAEPSQFMAHQPYVHLTDQTLEGPDVVLTADLVGDIDNDLQRVLWFKDFETTGEQLLGTGSPCPATLPAGAHRITCVAYDSRGAYGTGGMSLWVTPPNDNCTGAETVGQGLHWGDNTGATTEIIAPCANSHSDVWFRYVPRLPGREGFVKISTCDDGGTLKDTVLSVYEGRTHEEACGVAASACSDDGCGVENRRSSVRLLIESRTQFLIRVASYGTGGPTGTFPLWIEEVPVLPGDANRDGCVDVVDLLSLVYSFGLSAGDPGYDSTCDFNDDNTVDVADLLDMVYNFGACVD
jgi:hypothetical protein